MSAQHTSGQWFVTSQNGGSAGCAVWARGGDVIVAECRSPSISLPGRQCDARLIAAAPELLSALSKAADTFADIARYFRMLGKPEGAEAYGIAEKSARAVIAKATGAAP